MEQGVVPSDRNRATQWVLFDVGGVLIEWDDTIIFHKVANRYGVNQDVATRILTRRRRELQSGRISLREFWSRFARSLAIPMPENWRSLWVAPFARLVRPRNDVLDLAADLRKNGVRTGLFSNTDSAHWRELRSRGWFDDFHPQIVSFRLGTVKPNQQAFRRAAKIFPPGEGWPVLVDDSVRNVEGARAAGWEALHFTSARALRHELRGRRMLSSN